MDTPSSEPSDRKDLTDLMHLSRAPALSYLQKQAQPVAPRVKVAGLVPVKYPILAAFSPTRLWKWICEYWKHRIGPRHKFQSYGASDEDQGIYRMDDYNEVRLALAGDWATGTDEAECVAKLIAASEPHYSIHLGDVYFVGAQDEVNENFLGIKNPHNNFEPCLWPAGSRGTFALNANHEMYARGFAYFDGMLPKLGPTKNGKAAGQKTSYFCLENQYWRIIALDTGYGSIGWPILEYIFQPSCALRAEQLRWLRAVVRLREDDKRGIIFLGHHQYYSRYDYSYSKQGKQLAEFVSRPVLWFWGHEHRLSIYREFGVDGGIRAFGRCIGHGGMPVDLPPEKPKDLQCVAEFVDTREYPNDEGLTIGFNGFAQLSLRGNLARTLYVDVKGQTIFSEEWRANNGVLERINSQQFV